jgi:GMP synthase (glutamine-hydrolysing)
VPSLDSFTHIVILGGPMAVYEMHAYRHLRHEAVLIEQAIGSGKQVLGICLGAQMVAHVLGARVYAGAHKEIGWYHVELTEQGMRDRAVRHLSSAGTSAEVFQLHGDSFDLPSGAVGGVLNLYEPSLV